MSDARAASSLEQRTAALLDGLTLIVVSMAVFGVFAMTGYWASSDNARLVVAVAVLVVWMAYVILATAFTGQTLGKWLVGIRVVCRDDFSRPGLRRSVIRTAAIAPRLLLPFGGGPAAMADAQVLDGQLPDRSHDWVAGTTVLSQRSDP